MKPKGANNVIKPSQHHVTKMESKSFLTQKNLIKVTKKGNVALVQSIDYIHEVNHIKEKQTHVQEIILQRQLEYIKVQHMKMN
jgi:hypothetical protein